ncbi:MAG: DUF2726 domain-containing protein [Pseudomonadota bacterium]
MTIPSEVGTLWLTLGVLLIVTTVLPSLIRRSRRKSRKPRPGQSRTPSRPFSNPPNWYSAQAEALTRVSVHPTPLLNRSEIALQEMIRDWLATRDLPPLALHAQVSMGEMFRVSTSGVAGREGHSAFNAKRVDFLLVGADMLPLAGIEYQGGGHYQKDAVLRDAIKREVFRKAGIPFLEIKAKSKRSQVHRQLDACFGTAPPDVSTTSEATGLHSPRVPA